MKLIAHRGNINGPRPDFENSPEYILNTVRRGFDVEIDVWCKNDKWYLGHDEPQYPINFSFLKNKKFWCHAKNLKALEIMLKNNIHCFWHENDDFTLTSQGFVWTYPGKELLDYSVSVMPEKASYSWNKLSKSAGICSDYLLAYQEKLKVKTAEKIKVVLFDLDGVLVDACDWHYQALNEALQNTAGFKISNEEHAETFNGLPTKKKLQILTSQGRISEHQHDKIWKEKQSLTISIIEKYATINSSKKLMYEELKKREIIVGCVTNSIRKTADLMLEATGQLEHLSFVITNENVSQPKPDPEGYKLAMKILSVDPSEVLIVEDSDKGIAAATASGAHVLRTLNASKVNLSLVISKINSINQGSI